MDDFANSYDSGYDDLKLYPDESPMITVLKGILGAVIGAIPGMILWILIGKAGYIASFCGFVLAAGIVLGYGKMTGKGDLNIGVGVIVCLAIMVAAICLCQRIVWTWELADQFKDFFPTFKSEVISYIQTNYPEYSLSDIKAVVTDEYIENALVEEFGFSESTFANCSAHFGELLDKMELKGEFMKSVGQSLLYGFLGGGAMLYGTVGRAAKKN